MGLTGQRLSADKKDLRQFHRTIFAMVLPIALQNFMTAAVSASDAVMLGFLEQEALSAVSLAGQVTFVLNLLITVVVQGTTVLAAQYWGKGDRQTVERILGLALQYMFLVSVVFLCAAFFLPGQLMRIFTNDRELIVRGAEYLRIAGISYVPLGISQVYLCIMKNSGKTAKSTVIGSSSMILNVIFNVVFIFGAFGIIPALGIQGAALATVLATVIQMIWTLLESGKKESIHIRLPYLMKVDMLIRRDFNRYTLPIVGNYFFWGGGVTMYAVIIGHMGADAVAANSVANIVRNLIVCVTKGIGTAGAILVGNELGKNAIETAKRYARQSIVLAAVLGGSSGLLLFMIRPLILSFAALTPDALGYLSGMLLINCYYVVAGSINNMVIGGIFCAGGQSRFGCICDMIVLWLAIIPLAALAAFYLNLPVLAVYLIICMDEGVKVPIVLWYYRKYTWARNLTH